MTLLKFCAVLIPFLYCVVILLLYIFQSRIIFYPGKLKSDFKFKDAHNALELYFTTEDLQKINALFFSGPRQEVILYFHGNAGDLSGWQFIADDFTSLGYNFLVIDYRGYGKSSGEITEKGLYKDASGAWNFLLEKGFKSDQIIVYGRSVGAGIAVELAATHPCKGLILEAPYTSMGALANEKLPFLFPSLYLRFKFDNIQKMDRVKCPVVFFHGSNDTLIPASHTEKLFERYTGKKKKIIIAHGSHNDLNSFAEYHDLVKEHLSAFF
jgi:fermentation-respiration switch protein FrsA (DUF1100 family)